MQIYLYDFSFYVVFMTKTSDNETGWLDSVWNLPVNWMQMQEEREKVLFY